MTEKILLDTDIGTDIDDALCLAYLLSQPLCELIGITTVCGESFKRAMLASVFCKLADRDIPIYPGAEEPLIGEQKQKIAEQAVILTGWPHETNFPRGEAIEFLRNKILNNPGEITLLAIGPLTNIALLFKSDERIAGFLKRLVIMGGYFEKRMKEIQSIENFIECNWNICMDPYAGSIVYSNNEIRSHYSITFDITHKIFMNSENVKDAFKSNLLRPVADISKMWFKLYENIVFHDPRKKIFLPARKESIELFKKAWLESISAPELCLY